MQMLESQAPAEPETSPPRGTWQTELAESVSDPAELCRLLGLSPALAGEAERAAAGFSLLVSRPFLARIRSGDPADPLLLQVLPRALETAALGEGALDPLDERSARCGPDLLRKYQGRLLMVTTAACAVHCRFCFRRHFSDRNEGFEAAEGPISAPEANRWAPAIEVIAADRTVREIILSGGDPLALDDASLGQLADQLADIPHLRRLRIHTRLPVMIPARVTDDLVALLQSCRLTPYIVLHVNHPAEIDVEVAASLGRLIDAGIPVMSQSVLLRGVNDRIEILVALYERLVDLRVLPYYLHQVDRAVGATHFEVSVSVGLGLMAELRARLPGYAVPQYVRETPGATSKEVLMAC
jgi:EF-P beta-lysylation protein EpmB